MAVLIAVVVMLLLKPALGIPLGIIGLALSITYFSVSKVRPTVERILSLSSASAAKRYGLAAANLFYSLLTIGVSWAVLQSRAEQDEAAAAAAQQRAEYAAKMDEKAREEHAEAEEWLASAEAKLSAGDLEGAEADLLAAERLGASTDTANTRKKLADAKHSSELAKLPDMLAKIQHHNETGEWSTALSYCERAQALDPSFDGLVASCAVAEEAKRVASIPTWIEHARTVATNPELCQTPKVVAGAWGSLQKVKSTDPGYRKALDAAQKLEKCRKALERTFTDGLRDLMVNQRKAWAKQYETNALDAGLDVSVTLSGKYKTKAKIRWVLLSRAMVHQIVRDGEFLGELEKIGFEKVTFSDGYLESWSFELNPEPEDIGGKVVLDGFGLDKPLKL